jgi:hypothetical protein
MQKAADSGFRDRGKRHEPANGSKPKQSEIDYS